MESIFFEISAIIIAGTLLATVAKFFKQPMIPAYIFAGVLLGPPVFNLIHSEELLHTLSTFGIAFLLFLVGIELDLRKFLKTSKAAIILGFIQMSTAIGLGYLLIRWFGFDPTTSFFFSVALGFSSTIVVLKLLGERKELDTLYGQIVIGLMLTQDFIAILFLIFFNNVFQSSPDSATWVNDFLFTTIKGVFLFAMAFVSSRFVLIHIFRYFARSSELLFLGSICWCLIFAMLSILLGFSIEVGSLLAGVSLSFLPYSLQIASKVKSLRDFFLPIFFAVLGGQLVFSGNTSIFLPTVVLSALVLIVSPIVSIATLLFFRYRARTSFMAGMSVGQVSEFSFVLIALGHQAGVVSQDVVGLVALIGLVTMTLSTYIIEYIDVLYPYFQPLLKRFERHTIAHQYEDVPEQLNDHVILVGFHTMGYKIYELLRKKRKQVVVVDYNPDVITRLQKEDVPYVYGNMSDDDILERARIEHAQLVVSTAPDAQRTMELLKYVRRHRVKTVTIVTAYHVEDALDFYAQGADYVLYPNTISVDYLQHLIFGSLQTVKRKHVQELKELQRLAFVR